MCRVLMRERNKYRGDQLDSADVVKVNRTMIVNGLQREWRCSAGASFMRVSQNRPGIRFHSSSAILTEGEFSIAIQRPI